MIDLKLGKENVRLYIVTLLTCTVHVHMLSLQSCSSLCDTVDSSLPVSYVQGILQARILEWVAVPSLARNTLGGIPKPGIEPTGYLLLVPPGKPLYAEYTMGNAQQN